MSRIESGDFLEFELLRLGARMTIDPTAEERIRALAREGVDWNVLISRAHHHRVLPLLYRSLERVASDLVPETAMQRLRSASYANARRNLHLTGELLGLVDLLRAHDIPCIPYKGPVLAALVYGDISLRQFADLDIFVGSHDIARARALLESRGYQAGNKNSTDKDINLRRPDVDIELELHWRATSDTDPIQLPSQLLWTDLCPFLIAGKSVLTHGYEKLLLIQCVHGVRHGWERLGWVCDIAEIVQSQRQIEWDRAFRLAAEVGGERILRHGLALTRDFFDTTLPPTVVRAIEDDPVLPALSQQVKEWLVSDRPVALGEIERYFISLREHTADKLRVATTQARRYLTLTSRDAEALSVPRYLNWMLYIVRPFRLARDYGFSPFWRFFRGVFQW